MSCWRLFGVVCEPAFTGSGMPLGKRLAAMVLMLALIALVAAGLVAGSTLSQAARQEIDHDLLKTARAITPVVREGNLQSLNALSMADVSAIRLTVIASDGVVVFDNLAAVASMDNHNDRPEIMAARSTGFGWSERDSDTLGVTMRYCAVLVSGGNDGTMVVRTSLPLTSVQAQVVWVWQGIAAGTIVAAIIALLLAMILGRKSCRAIKLINLDQPLIV